MHGYPRCNFYMTKDLIWFQNILRLHYSINPLEGHWEQLRGYYKKVKEYYDDDINADTLTNDSRQLLQSIELFGSGFQNVIDILKEYDAKFEDHLETESIDFVEEHKKLKKREMEKKASETRKEHAIIARDSKLEVETEQIHAEIPSQENKEIPETKELEIDEDWVKVKKYVIESTIELANKNRNDIPKVINYVKDFSVMVCDTFPEHKENILELIEKILERLQRIQYIT